MKTLLLILLTSLSCLGQERVVIVHYNKGFAKIVHSRIVDKQFIETTLATIERDTLFILDRYDLVIPVAEKHRNKYKSTQLIYNSKITTLSVPSISVFTERDYVIYMNDTLFIHGNVDTVVDLMNKQGYYKFKVIKVVK